MEREIGSYIDDPGALFEHEYRASRRLSRRPVCVLCGEPIQDDYCYVIGGDILCEDCLADEHRRFTDDLMEDGDE